MLFHIIIVLVLPYQFASAVGADKQMKTMREGVKLKQFGGSLFGGALNQPEEVKEPGEDEPIDSTIT